MAVNSKVFGLRAVFRQTPFQLPVVCKRALVILLASPGAISCSFSTAQMLHSVPALLFTFLYSVWSVSRLSYLPPQLLGRAMPVLLCFCSPFLWAMPGWGVLAPQPRCCLSSRVQRKERACPQPKAWVSALWGHFKNVSARDISFCFKIHLKSCPGPCLNRNNLFTQLF